MTAVIALIQARYVSSVFIASPPFRWLLPRRREHVGVAGDHPGAGAPGENRQRIPDPLHRRSTISRRHRDAEPRPHPGPVPEDPELLDFAPGLDAERPERCLAGRERRPAAHWRMARGEEDDVVGHQAQYLVGVAGTRGVEPSGDQLPDRVLV